MTAGFLVPSQLNDLISHPQFDAGRLKSLRKMGYAGAPMAPALLARIYDALPGLAYTENYGQSETCPITVLSPSHPKDKLGTVGRLACNVDLRIVDPDGNTLPTGAVGEITVRSDTVFQEYYGDPDQTAAAFPKGDGWLWTGDVGFLDEDGFLTLVDRSKDMLVSGGENVYPAEIENALYRHEAVAECAVFGIPDERWGEVPAAHVVLVPDASVTAEALMDFCASKIARFKRPRVIKFVDSLPRTPVGKIQKVLIREPYWQDHEKKI